MKNVRMIVVVLSALMSMAAECVQAEGRMPKLVVGIVVDQMRWDYLERYAGRWGEGGFRRLMAEGYGYDNAYLCYVPTVTAVGHASVYTGTTPAIHGIAGNNFFVDGRKCYCTDDHEVRTVGTDTRAGEMSPRNLLSTTIGDQLKLACEGAKVIGVSLKDRAAILPAGHSADAAYWFDTSAGMFITSSYYMDRLPAWVDEFNRSHRVKSDMRYSPDGITLTADMAIAAIEGERLGQRNVTDMLAVSFSSTDYVGHKYGTRAPETEAVYKRVDEELRRILDCLDSKVGRGEYLLFLTADHAAAHNAQELAARNIPAGTWSEDGALRDANEYLKKTFGTERELVKALIEYRFYIDRVAVTEAGLSFDKVKAALRERLESAPCVMACIDYSSVKKETLPPAVLDRIVMGYNRKRSGDLMVVMQPGYYAFGATSFEHGTTHGVWNPYDSHIPLFFYGWNVGAGRSSEAVKVTDIATTVCAKLRIQQPNGSVGRVLVTR